MRRQRCILFFFMYLLSFNFSHSVFAFENDLYPFTSATELRRFESLTHEVRCVVCQNQNLAESTAPLANDLRGKIYRMILDKKSDEEIKNYLVMRYGEFILLNPPFNKTTIFLWIFPFAALFCAALFLRYSYRKS